MDGLIPLTFQPPPPERLRHPAPAPGRQQFQEQLDGELRPYSEVRRWPALNGQRAVLPDQPLPEGPGQQPWGLYAVELGAPTFGGWDEDCSCDDEGAA